VTILQKPDSILTIQPLKINFYQNDLIVKLQIVTNDKFLLNGLAGMNLNQLKLFYYTAKFNSPTAAAEHLFISQPAVTTGIHRLEDHYNVKFFKREGQYVSLNEAGKKLYTISYPVDNPKIEIKEVLTDQFVIIVAPDHPIANQTAIYPKNLEFQANPF
jgi:DNA-binding MarR family transcriptional regulator